LQAGFTLVELMMGIVISTMIMGATAAAMVTVLENWKRGSGVYEEQQAAEKTCDLFERHLRGALAPASGDNAVFTGTDLSLDELHPGHILTMRSGAASRFPRNLPPTDASEVTFEFDPALDARLIMRIQSPPDSLPEEGGYQVTLSDRIVGLRILYFDGIDWIESWEFQNSLPMAVEFHLWLERGEGRPPDADLTYDPILEGNVREVRRLIWLPIGQGTPESQLLSILGTESEEQPMDQSDTDNSGGGGNGGNSGGGNGGDGGGGNGGGGGESSGQGGGR
jgi:prepilin-type N-terminal cleavage/methylation domain-containing protein